jgi:hypothetical protein
MKFLSCLLATLSLALAATGAFAQAPDTVLLNGKIVTADGSGTVAQALAVRDGRIVALGKSATVKRLAGKTTRVVDLGGRTVIPGLIDSHMHAIRAAQSYTTEVHWFGTTPIEEALGRLRNAARAARPGAWLAGGWTEDQFRERRRPTQAELVAAAPDNPVYVQWMYGWAMLTPLAHKALALNAESDLPAGGKFVRDTGGSPTGAVASAANTAASCSSTARRDPSSGRWNHARNAAITEGLISTAVVRMRNLLWQKRVIAPAPRPSCSAWPLPRSAP